MSFTQSVSGIRQADTNRGDTLPVIALRELGDASLWHDLAQLNGLAWPYLVDDPAKAGPRVLVAGQQTILIPSPQPPIVGVVDATSVFGIDAALVKGRLTATPGGDIATVAGTPNLVAALTRALDTDPGELLYHPDYGCLAHTLVGRGGSGSVAQLAAGYVARTLIADPRVSSVSNSTASLAGDTLTATATAVTVDGKQVPVGTS